MTAAELVARLSQLDVIERAALVRARPRRTGFASFIEQLVDEVQMKLAETSEPSLRR